MPDENSLNCGNVSDWLAKAEVSADLDFPCYKFSFPFLTACVGITASLMTGDSHLMISVGLSSPVATPAISSQNSFAIVWVSSELLTVVLTLSSKS